MNTQTQRLADLVHRKHECLSQLRDLGRRQLELAEQGSMEPLMKVLIAKQQHVDLLAKLERELDPFRQQDPESRSWSTPEARQECAALSESCSHILQEVLAQEQRSEMALRIRRDELHNKIQGTHVAQSVHQAYVGCDHETVSAADCFSPDPKSPSAGLDLSTDG